MGVHVKAVAAAPTAAGRNDPTTGGEIRSFSPAQLQRLADGGTAAAAAAALSYLIHRPEGSSLRGQPPLAAAAAAAAMGAAAAAAAMAAAASQQGHGVGGRVSSTSESGVAPGRRAGERMAELASLQKKLEDDQAANAAEQRKRRRDETVVSQAMLDETKRMLMLFGLPYVTAPMEAEAQCAALEELGLVDGIITDDADVFLFGGKNVYKNIFTEQKFVESYRAADIEGELGCGRPALVRLALLLGSDYTLGVRGVGVVNALEVLGAYPPATDPKGLDGLADFHAWCQTAAAADRQVAGAVQQEGLDSDAKAAARRLALRSAA